jgi:hypothetical protein
MIKKTMYNSEKYWPNFDRKVLFVGFNPRDGVGQWLNEAASFAGYKSEIIRLASGAKDYMKDYGSKMVEAAIKEDYGFKHINNCIVNARYDYGDDSAVPVREVPFCGLEGLTYYEKRKRPFQGFFQGLQFARQVAEDHPDIKFAIYGNSYNGIPSQTKLMKMDFIPALSKNVFVPFTILEYLRNQNTELFAK